MSPTIRCQISGIGLRSVAAALLLSVACTRSPASPTPTPVILDQEYFHACGSWKPGEPPDVLTLVDFRVITETPEGRPTREAIDAIIAAGGRIAHVYHAPLVRAVMTTSDAARVAGRGRPVWTARTVTDRTRFDVNVIVMLTHPPSDELLDRARALGAVIKWTWPLFSGYSAIIPDAAIPALRAFPEVRSVNADSAICLD